MIVREYVKRQRFHVLGKPNRAGAKAGEGGWEQPIKGNKKSENGMLGNKASVIFEV